MDPKIQIEEYIREHQGRYTREAMREQLVAAGHSQAAVDSALDQAAASSAQRAAGWRPGWREFLILLVLGAIGAAIAWANEPYGAGAIAPVVYAIILAMGFGIGKLVSILIDGGNSRAAGALLALVAAGGVYLGVINGMSPIALAIAAVAGVLAVLLFTVGPRHRGLSGSIGAGLPIVVWLVVTGTCMSPLFVR
jgi:uncharacterized membrane protein YccC